MLQNKKFFLILFSFLSSDQFLSSSYEYSPEMAAARDYQLTTTMHYENMLKQYLAIFHGCKNETFQMKNCDIFLSFAQNIDSGFTLVPPH